MEKKPEIPTSTRDEALFIPAAMHKESLCALSNAKYLTLLRRQDRPPGRHAVLEEH